MEKPTLTPAQCHAARCLLDWSRDVLADRSGVSKRSLTSFEAGQTALMPNNLRAIAKAFEDEGVVFVPGGVHFAKGVDDARNFRR
jgi:transcriptional regulator with XRE-family HTH domain